MTGRLLGRQRALVAGAALVTLVAGGGSAAYAVTLNQPTDVVCGPFENGGLDRNVVYWTDTSDGETGFRVERSVDGGAFTTLATAPANTGSHIDSGLTAGRVYRYRVLAVDGTTTGPVSEQCRQFAFFDSPEGNFRTYFRPYAVADCPPRFGAPSCVPATTTAGGANEYGSRIGGLLEGSLTALRAVGFEDFATYGGGKRFPVDLIWCDGGGCAGADIWGPLRKGFIGLAPQFMGPYDPVTGAGDPSSVLITLHEAFHQAQFAYGGAWGDPAGSWVYEGQARSIQDKVCVGTAASCVSLDAVPGGLANYLGDVQDYLADPGRDVTRLSYTAALFWTYLLEQYGRTTAEPGRGMDLMHEFWVQGRANFFDTGIGTIDRTLAALGHTDRFADVFRNFAVANYAKDLTGPSVPARYKYADEQQPPGRYPAVALRADLPLAVGGRVGPTADTVPSWGVRYYEFEPAAATPLVDVRVTQDAPANPAFYSLLLIKDGDIVEEIRSNGPDFARAVPNDGYDKVVLVVGGLANALSYRYSVDTSGSLLRIVDPLTSRKAQAGTATAPRKVLVKAALRSATGDPMAGLGASAFAVTIGGRAATIVSSAFLQGQYWLLVQAPTQPADGTYDLGVAAAGLSAAQPQAVVYGAPPNTDSEVVVDRSGSMLDHDKLPSAKAGARLYVDTWEASDEAGLVSFNHDATVDKALDPLTPAHRGDVKTAIDALSGGGSTSIGDGLYAALDQLDTRGDQGDNWAVVVLSDGLENTERRIADFLATYAARRTAGTKNPKVHTIALGPDADRVNMQKLAAETGGTYHAAAVDTTAPGSGLTAMSAANGEPRDSGNALAAVYRQISQEAAGEQQVFSAAGPLPASETFAVDGGTERLSVALHANSSDFTPALLDPAGVAHAPTRSDTGHAYWRIPGPAAGEWTLDVTCGRAARRSSSPTRPSSAA